jgi:hypothetical protein
MHLYLYPHVNKVTPPSHRSALRKHTCLIPVLRVNDSGHVRREEEHK